MPYSSDIFNEKVVRIITKINPKTCLDIGAGAGKYGLFIKENLPNTKTVGIEVEENYIKKFNLLNIYDEIWNIPAINLIDPKYYELNFDLVFFGDVLEHMRKSDAIDLLNFLVYRSKFILAIFPHKYLQNTVDGYASEAHISVWNKNDLLSFETTKILSKDMQRLIVIKGYLKSRLKIGDLDNLLVKQLIKTWKTT